MHTDAEDSIHAGHRARMRAKLTSHGARIFDTYELIEMLLYYVIPYKDTNPIAKRLLAKFGTLDGVLSATVDQLVTVEGVGVSAAEFLASVGRVTDVLGIHRDEEPMVFDDYDETGRFFVDYFNETEDTNIVFLLLDNCMRLQGIEKIPGDNYGSAAVKAKYFISAAIKHSATVGIVAYTHRTGLPYPFSGDYETTRMLRHELTPLGINLIEEYVVGSKDYSGSILDVQLKSPPSPAMARFLSGREGYRK